MLVAAGEMCAAPAAGWDVRPLVRTAKLRARMRSYARRRVLCLPVCYAYRTQRRRRRASADARARDRRLMRAQKAVVQQRARRMRPLLAPATRWAPGTSSKARASPARSCAAK
jgi:hypothetical protein